jgi:hypothetical protein
VDVFGHHDEGMDFESSLAAIAVEGFEKQPCVGFDDK